MRKKKNLLLLLFICNFVVAQNVTLLTPNGKKVTVKKDNFITADNGLTVNGVNVELGGNLTKNTTITSGSVANTILEIKGLNVGALKITDGNQAAGKILTSTADGTASWQPFLINTFHAKYIAEPPANFLVPGSKSSFTIPTTGSCKVPVSGRYLVLFHYLIGCKNIGNTQRSQIRVKINTKYSAASNDFLSGGSSEVIPDGNYFTNQFSKILIINQPDDEITFTMSADQYSFIPADQVSKTYVEVIYLGK